MRAQLAIGSFILAFQAAASSADPAAIPQPDRLNARAKSFVRALVKADARRSFELTIYSAKHLATYQQWSEQFGSPDGDDKVLKWALGSATPLDAKDLENLASGFRDLGVSVDSAVLQRVAVETRESREDKKLLPDEYDQADYDWELLWLHVDDSWYFFDVNLCNPITMKPNSRMNPTVRPVTSLAKSASPAPGRPAGYAER